MAKAIWNGVVLAESDQTIMVEGNHYFPRDSVNLEYLIDSSSNTSCPWKGIASYYTVAVNGDENHDAAWYYPDPSNAASLIKDYIAFWRGVKVSA